jgi:hypothetical protein
LTGSQMPAAKGQSSTAAGRGTALRARRSRAYGSLVRFHPLCIRHAARIAWCGPSNWVQFVQFDQQLRRASDIASASHAEGRWFDPSRDHTCCRIGAADQIADCGHGSIIRQEAQMAVFE